MTNGGVLTSLYAASARLVRLLRQPKRFERARATRRLQREILTWWTGGIDALFEYLTEIDGWDKIQRHVRLGLVADKALIRKALSNEDSRLIAELLARYGYYDDVQQMAAAIVAATAEPTFEEAATHALKQLGVASPEFRLVNDRIRENILARKSEAVHATRKNVESIMQTIVDNFYDLGRNPFHDEFLASLRKELGNVAAYQAKRFALTETAIVAEMAQFETWSRNGVTGKRWNILGVNTRDSHRQLNGVEIGINEQFLVVSSDGNTYEAKHPSDPKLPAHELINCHCYATPVVSDQYEIDPTRIWEGQ